MDFSNQVTKSTGDILNRVLFDQENRKDSGPYLNEIR